MNLDVPFGPRDDRSGPDGDLAFLGVDERIPPAQLPSGYCAYARNKRFRDGKAADRFGIQILRWGKEGGETPFDEIYGGEVFEDPNQPVEWVLIAADGGVWKCRPNNAATPVPLPAGVVLTAATFAQFVQCMNVIVLLRGPDADPLVCEDLDEGFKEIVQAPGSEGSGTQPIPRSSFGVYMLNRLVLIKDKDQVAVSDLLDYTHYQEVTETFQINAGDNDTLLGLYILNGNTVIALKSKSIYQILNVGGDLSQAVGPLEVTRKYGIVARRSAVTNGAELYWLSQSGLVSMQLTALNQNQNTSITLTDPMLQTWERVNPLFISGAVAEIWNSRLYLGVPLDDAQFVGAEMAQMQDGNPSQYSADTPFSPQLQIGKKYKYAVGSAGGRLVNGTETLDGDCDFIAQGVSVDLYPSDTQLTLIDVTASLKEVRYEGVNNGVMVYDFVNQAWCGVDEAEGVLCVKQWLKPYINGAQRLVAICNDGFLRVYEEGYDDERLLPLDLSDVPGAQSYADILVKDTPQAGLTISLGTGGDVIAASEDVQNDEGGLWGCSQLSFAVQNLWSNNGFGYDHSLPGAWFVNYPEIVTQQIEGGIRVYSTDTTVAVTVTGEWAFIDRHEGPEIQSVPIESKLVTRGYLCVGPDKKRYVSVLALLSTWSPNYDVSTIVNGVSEETAYASGVTRDRTKYEVHGQADYDPSNINGDFFVAKREDYSVDLGQSPILLGTGVNFDQMQDTEHRIPVDEKGYWMQVVIFNRNGRMEVRSVLLEAIPGDRESGIGV